jgi:hypothetical protein
MGTIVPFLSETGFGPDEIKAMSLALDDVCQALKLDGHSRTREVVAIRILELARRGERSPIRLRDRILQEANGRTPLPEVAGGLGFEPRLTESESAVLPLDDPPPEPRV